MNRMNSKKKYIFLFLLPIISIALIFIFHKNREKHNKNIFNINPQLIDSVYNSLPSEHKIKNLIIASDTSSTEIAGFSNIIVNDDDTIMSKFFFLKNLFLFPDSLSVLFNDYNSILATFNDSVFLNIVRKNIDLDTNSGYNAFIIPLTPIADTNITDTAMLNFYENITLKSLNILKNKNFIVAVEAIPLSSDSIRRENLINFYNLLTTNNLINSLFFNSKISAGDDFFKQFDLLKIANTIIFDDYDDFIRSDIDLMFIDTTAKITAEELFDKLKSTHKVKKNTEKKLKKIIAAKIWVKKNDCATKNLNFNSKDLQILKRKIYKNSLVLLSDSSWFPQTIGNQTYFCYIFSDKNFKKFKSTAQLFVNTKFFDNQSIKSFNHNNLKNKDNIIFIFDTLPTPETQKIIKKIDSSHNLLTIIFNNVDSTYIPSKNSIIAWNYDNLTQFYVAQAIFGGIEINGRMPFSVNNFIKFGDGKFAPKTRLSYDIPEMANLNSEKLKKIDSIVYDAIAKNAFPGCQVFIAKNGIIVWDKAYGYLTYSKRHKVTKHTLYDIASLTKIASTTLATMKMYETGKLSLSSPIGKYFKDTHIDYSRVKKDMEEKFLVNIDTINIKIDEDWKKKIQNTDTVHLNDSLIISIDSIKYDVTPKNNIFKVTPQQLLTHKSGITPVLPILPYLFIDENKISRIKELFSPLDTTDTSSKLSYIELKQKYYTEKFIKDSAEIQIAENMYLKNNYFDTLWEDTKALHVLNKKIYVYSDVNMILLQMTIDTINNFGINIYVYKNFYKKLGLKYITFKPLKYFSKNEIAPSERDRYWRMQTVQGYVHDPSAALLGGIAGNAGLFANAENLGILGQMLLNYGQYGNIRFLKKSTIEKFTETQPDTHRGLGFDKWSKKQIIAPDASPNTYGHTGFTGTCMWIDPDNEIVFVFLSNRTYPSAKNWKINRYKVRQKIHQTVYEAIQE